MEPRPCSQRPSEAGRSAGLTPLHPTRRPGPEGLNKHALNEGKGEAHGPLLPSKVRGESGEFQAPKSAEPPSPDGSFFPTEAVEMGSPHFF